MSGANFNNLEGGDRVCLLLLLFSHIVSKTYLDSITSLSVLQAAWSPIACQLVDCNGPLHGGPAAFYPLCVLHTAAAIWVCVFHVL